MKRWPLPSLAVRLFLIVLGGVVLAITISNSFHFHERKRLLEEYRDRAVTENLANALRLLAEIPMDLRASVVRALPKGEWSIQDDNQAADGEPAPAIAEGLADRLGEPFLVEGVWSRTHEKCEEEAGPCLPRYQVLARLGQGQAVWLGYTPKPHERQRRFEQASLHRRDFLLIAIMAAVAWLVVRLALRPLQRMTEAAESFGRDIDHPSIDISGPVEVRRAACAFNAMQEDIRAYMAERTQILAAVAHDLKTPLTRMRLKLETCEDLALQQKIRTDLDTMQALLEEGLDLARSLDSKEATEAVDLDALLQSLCDDFADIGLPVTYRGLSESGVVVAVRPKALARVFGNIIDNALKYGGYARVSLDRQDGKAVVHIIDGGPGIPEEHLQNVLKPFVRVESSRSRETGGTGLGLAIAVNLLRPQQGKLELRNPPQGGLEVTVSLPIVSL